MALKNITFIFFVVLVVMIAIKLLNTNLPEIPFFTTSLTNQMSTGNTHSDIDQDDDFVIPLYNTASKPITEPVPEPVTKPKYEELSVNLDGYSEIYSGMFYKKIGDITIVRVDLTNPDVRFFVNPPTAPMTVCDHLNLYGLQFATNGGDFDMGGTGQAKHFSMNDGVVYSWDQTPGITIFISNDNHLSFSTGQEIPDGTKYAISGFNRLVENGEMVSKYIPGNPGYKEGYGSLRRRTSYGLSGNWLNIVLFDYGISVTDEGQYHLDNFPGTEHVFNMDGGGSTNACTSDYGSLVTESGRAVANVFGIYSVKK